MRNILTLFIATILGIGFISGQAGAAEQKAVLMITGKACAAHPKEINDALMGIKGVKTVDLKSMRGHAVVAHDGSVKPEALIDALKKAKGSESGADWYCDAEAMP